MGGITRVHGGLVAPRNLAGVSLQDFTLTFWVGDSAGAFQDFNSGAGSTPGGPFDQIFRNATGNVGTVSRIGTLQNTATSATLNFAVEVSGVNGDPVAVPGALGQGSTEDSTYAYASTALALQGRIQALGNVAFTGANGSSYTAHMSSATVVAFTY